MSITKHNIKWINNADLKQGFQSAINDELDDIKAETKNAVNPFQNNQIYELDCQFTENKTFKHRYLIHS